MSLIQTHEQEQGWFMNLFEWIIQNNKFIGDIYCESNSTYTSQYDIWL